MIASVVRRFQPRVWLWLIIAVAFALRLAANVALGGLHDGPNRKAFGADAVEFNAIAANVVLHHEFSVDAGVPTSFRAPGFPLTLAGVYAIAGVNNFVAARLFFCLIGAALCAATYAVAVRVAGAEFGLIAAFLVAVYPNIFYYNIHFASEPVFTLLLVLSVFFMIRSDRPSIVDVAVSGLLLGLATLVRPVAFYFGPIYAAVLLLRVFEWGAARTVTNVAVFAALLIVPVAPWVARNWVVHDRFLLVASNGGSTFWGANNSFTRDVPEYQGGWVTTNMMGAEKDDVRALQNEVDKDRLEFDHGRAFIEQNPGSLPRMLWYKFREFWTPVMKTPNRVFNLAISSTYGVALLLMIAGAVMIWRQPSGYNLRALIIAMAPVAGTAASCLVFYGSARFRSTVDPLLLLLTAVPIYHLLFRPTLDRSHSPRHLSR